MRFRASGKPPFATVSLLFGKAPKRPSRPIGWFSAFRTGLSAEVADRAPRQAW